MPRFATPAIISSQQSEPTVFSKKISVQRILREFPDVFKSIENGTLSGEAAHAMIADASETVRACMLDSIGEVHTDLLDSFASIIIKTHLDGHDIDSGKLSQIIKASFAASKSIWNDYIPSKNFNLSDKASVASTLITTTVKLQILQIKHEIPDLYIAGIVDLIAEHALTASRDILGENATYKDIYNLAQSCMRHLTDVFVAGFKPGSSLKILHEAEEELKTISAVLTETSKSVLERQFKKPDKTDFCPSP